MAQDNSTPITLKLYHPAFVEKDPEPLLVFDTEEALLNSEALARFKKRDDFYRFEFRAGEGRNTILATYKGGAEWWVVGFTDVPLATVPPQDVNIIPANDTSTVEFPVIRRASNGLLALSDKEFGHLRSQIDNGDLFTFTNEFLADPSADIRREQGFIHFNHEKYQIFGVSVDNYRQITEWHTVHITGV